MTSFLSLSPSFSICRSDDEDRCCWHSPRLLLRFPDEEEEAAWPNDEFIIPDVENTEDEPSAGLMSLPGSPLPLHLQIPGVHRPYEDGTYEFEYFFSHHIYDDRLRMKTMWASGEITHTAAANFIENLDLVMKYIFSEMNARPNRRIGAVERYLWFDELALDIHEVRRQLLKEDSAKDLDFKLPLFSLDPFQAPQYYQTPEPAVDEEGKQKNRRVPSGPNVGYMTPRVDPDSVPDRVLGETPKKRATALRRAGDVTQMIMDAK